MTDKFPIWNSECSFISHKPDITSCNDTRGKKNSSQVNLTDESLTKSPVKTMMWNAPLFLQTGPEVTVFLSLAVLLYETLFHRCMSITRSNSARFVSIAATSFNKTESSQMKSWGGFSKQVSGRWFPHPAHRAGLTHKTGHFCVMSAVFDTDEPTLQAENMWLYICSCVMLFLFLLSTNPSHCCEYQGLITGTSCFLILCSCLLLKKLVFEGVNEKCGCLQVP